MLTLDERRGIRAKMRELLATESMWTKGEYGLDNEGNTVPADSRLCRSRGIVGAYRVAWSSLFPSAPDPSLSVLYERLDEYDPSWGGCIAGWNDRRDRKHSEVLAFLEADK